MRDWLQGAGIVPASGNSRGGLASVTMTAVDRPAPWRTPQPPGPSRTYAAVDLGTNNCRLLVARPSRDGFRVIDAYSRIVRLGEGLGANGALTPAAMERTIAALKVCAGKMERRGVSQWRAVATEACRRAGNFAEFRDTVKYETGITLEVITSAEEARLAMNGCAPLLDPRRRRALMFDIGGGSTEVMWLRIKSGRPEVVDCISLPVGVIGLAELHGGDRVSPTIYESVIDNLMEALGAFESRHEICDHIAAGSVQMLGSSGTVTTLAGVLMRLPRYDRSAVDGSFLSFDDVRDVSAWLLSLDYRGRAAQPCIGRDRADLVVAGCAVLEAICRRWPVGRLRIADRGVREGILSDLMSLRTRRPRRRRNNGNGVQSPSC